MSVDHERHASRGGPSSRATSPKHSRQPVDPGFMMGRIAGPISINDVDRIGPGTCPGAAAGLGHGGRRPTDTCGLRETVDQSHCYC